MILWNSFLLVVTLSFMLLSSRIKHTRQRELMGWVYNLGWAVSNIVGLGRWSILYSVSTLFVEMTLNLASVAPERTYKNLNARDKLLGFAHALFGRYPDFWLKAASTLKERPQPWLMESRKRHGVWRKILSRTNATYICNILRPSDDLFDFLWILIGASE